MKKIRFDSSYKLLSFPFEIDENIVADSITSNDFIFRKGVVITTVEMDLLYSVIKKTFSFEVDNDRIKVNMFPSLGKRESERNEFNSMPDVVHPIESVKEHIAKKDHKKWMTGLSFMVKYLDLITNPICEYVKSKDRPLANAKVSTISYDEWNELKVNYSDLTCFVKGGVIQLYMEI